MTPDDPNKPDAFDPLETESDFSDFDQGGSSLGDILRNNMVVKGGIVVAVIAALIGGVALFGGNAPENKSDIGNTPNIKETPGTADLNPQMREALEAKDQQRLDEATKQGTSAIPTVLEPPKEQNTAGTQNQGTEDDPFARWRKVQEERAQLEAQQQVNTQQQQINAQQQARSEQMRDQKMQRLSQAMGQQMESILKARAINSPQYATMMSYDQYLKNKEEEAQKLAEQQAALQQTQQQVAQAEAAKAQAVIPATTINYAQMLTEANSEAPGPVLVQLASGPLAGGRLLGSFQTTESFLILKFNRLVYNGKQYKTDAIALDPNTTLPAMATDVDSRWLERFVLPAAASFIEGVAGQAAEQGTTTIVTTPTSTTSTENRNVDFEQQLFAGVEEGAKKVSDRLNKDADQIKPIIRVAAGTAMGILFVEPVVEDTGQGTESQQQQLPYGPYPAYGYPALPYGVPFYGAPGFQQTGQPSPATGSSGGTTQTSSQP